MSGELKGLDLYRTPGLERGVFSRTGNLHLHVDGGGSPDLALTLLKRLEASGISGKLNLVLDSIEGPQRALLPETYESHTPASAGVEQFEYFATVGVSTRERAIAVLREILPTLDGSSGAVVEVERVIGRIDAAGALKPMPSEHTPMITADDVGVKPAPTLPYEIHHAFDIPEASVQLALGQLLKDTEELGLMVGGWFTFARRGCVSYRSNAFANFQGLVELVSREHKVLHSYMNRAGFQCPIRTVVEEIIGIWRTGTDAPPTF